jgi:hypothetical protein
MPDWSIKIVPEDEAPTGFVPDLKGAKPGEALSAQIGDIVTWNNTSSEDCWPWPTDGNGNPLPDSQVSTANGNYLCNKIAAGESSTPYFNPSASYQGKTLTYCCRLHPKIVGSIAIS